MECARLEKIEEECLAAELRADKEKTFLAQLAKERHKAEKLASEWIRQHTQRAGVSFAEQVAVERAIAEMNRQGAVLLEAKKNTCKKTLRKTRKEAKQVSAELERHKMLEAERTWAEKNAALIYNATARLSF